jgi:predicted porin
MNKKLITLAVAGVLGVAPALSTADVKVYGKAQVQIESVDRDTAAGSQVSVNDDYGNSRLGFKATEDLGNGLTGIAVMEFSVDPSAISGVGGRESWVGLKGSFGTVSAGTLKSAYKYTGGVKYDPFVATPLQARGNGGMSGNSPSYSAAGGGAGAFGHNGYLANSLGYSTPKMNGFSAMATYSPDETSTATGASDGDYSLSVKYDAGNFEVFAKAVNNDTNSAATDYSSTAVGGQFRMGDHKFSVQYEMTDPAGTADPTFLFLGWQGKFGNNKLVAQYGMYDSDGGNDATYYALGAIHSFSKTTRLFGGYSATDVDNAGADRTAFTVGMVKDF